MIGQKQATELWRERTTARRLVQRRMEELGLSGYRVTATIETFPETCAVVTVHGWEGSEHWAALMDLADEYGFKLRPAFRRRPTPAYRRPGAEIAGANDPEAYPGLQTPRCRDCRRE